MDVECTPSSCQNLRSAPQKQLRPKMARSCPAGSGASSGVPRTKCSVDSRCIEASIKRGMLPLPLHGLMITVGDGGVSLRPAEGRVADRGVARVLPGGPLHQRVASLAGG